MLALVPFFAIMPVQEPLSSRLDKLLDAPPFQGAIVGVSVVREDGTQLFGRNEDVRLMPASNQKLLSTAYALHALGPDWRSKTRFWKEPAGLYVDCPGDPSMTYAKLKEAAKKLGLKGDLPIFARQGYRAGVPPTWENDDLPHRYAPRITALTIERGSFTLASKGGKPILTPESFGVRIIHVAGGPVRTSFDPFGGIMLVRGDMPAKDGNLENFAIPEPDEAAASLLGVRLFEATGIPTREPDLVIEGDTVAKMVQDCLPPSDNYLAEGLMMLAAMKEGPLAEDPYRIGPARMRAFLTTTVSLKSEEVRPYDGSGMSRHNFVTPEGITKLLCWARRQPWGRFYEEAMAKPGKAGTLSSRLKGSSFVGKTGSLNSVATLSGYLRDSSGQTLAVSIMVNHFIAPPADVRAAMDAIVAEIEKPAANVENLASLGADFEGRMRHESRRSLPLHPAAHGDRLCGSRRDGVAVLAGTHR